MMFPLGSSTASIVDCRCDCSRGRPDTAVVGLCAAAGASCSHAGSSTTILQFVAVSTVSVVQNGPSCGHAIKAAFSMGVLTLQLAVFNSSYTYLRGRMTSSCTRNTGQKLIRAHAHAHASSLACQQCGCRLILGQVRTTDRP